MADKQHFKLFACCKMVRGASRSAIYDLQRGDIHFIPNSLYEVFNSEFHLPVEKVLEMHNTENQNVIKEYLFFLEENELGFYTAELEQFPDLDEQWQSPSEITNSIIDFKETSKHNVKNIFLQLDALGCQAIQLRFFYPVKMEELSAILINSRGLGFRSIEVFLVSNEDWNEYDQINDFLKEHLCISHFFVFGSKKEELLANDYGTIINFIEKGLKLDDCGQIGPRYFISSIPFYTEAKQYNTCLNRKISIDWHGEIKNCPSMKKSYGSVKNQLLSKVAATKEFQEFWHLKKDDIKICKQCEFRYACSDCRAYLSDANDLLSKPAKCNYNPEKP